HAPSTPHTSTLSLHDALPISLSNLALLCRRHHRAVHEEGYGVERQADGELRFRRPDGRPLPHVPPLVAVPSDPVHALLAVHDAQDRKSTRLNSSHDQISYAVF